MTDQDKINKLAKDLKDYKELCYQRALHTKQQESLITTLEKRIFLLECEVEGLDPLNVGPISSNNPLISTIYTPTSLFGKYCPQRIFNDIKTMTIKEFMTTEIYKLKGIGRKRYQHAVITIIRDKLYDRRKEDVF